MSDVTIDGYLQAGQLSVTIDNVDLAERSGPTDWKDRFAGINSTIVNPITGGAEVMILCAAEKATDIVKALAAHFEQLKASCSVVCKT